MSPLPKDSLFHTISSLGCIKVDYIPYPGFRINKSRQLVVSPLLKFAS